MAIEKVCVRIPADRREDLLKIASDMRASALHGKYRGPGWDAQAISKIVENHFGNDQKNMFESFGWPERGSNMMISRGKHIKETFGGVEEFLRDYPVDGF